MNIIESILHAIVAPFVFVGNGLVDTIGYIMPINDYIFVGYVSTAITIYLFVFAYSLLRGGRMDWVGPIYIILILSFIGFSVNNSISSTSSENVGDYVVMTSILGSFLYHLLEGNKYSK